LIEGDATLTMAMYVASNPLRALTFLKSIGAMGISTEELDKAPRALRETLLFPYQEGMNWTRALYRKGGWSEVSTAFTTLPQSTEQVLHPEKYFAHEAPVKVTLPDLTNFLNDGGAKAKSALADGSTTRPGWKKIASDVDGEWGFYLILDQFLKSPADSRRAAAGWAGDRTAVYESANGAVVYVSLSTWDTENDAREFFDAYVRRTQLRYPRVGSENSASDAQTFHTPEGSVGIELRGTRVTIVEGVPDEKRLVALLQLLRQSN
jgi:hypothetical protein